MDLYQDAEANGGPAQRAWSNKHDILILAKSKELAGILFRSISTEELSVKEASYYPLTNNGVSGG